MAFKIIKDPETADQLWVTGLLWWKYKSQDDRGWQVDTTHAQGMDWCKPSLAWSYCHHAIQVEE